MPESSAATHDAPIRSASEDRLERNPFAALIAATLLAPNEHGATVVGLTGAWGTGKSSVAAMVVERIGDSANVVRFDPWMISTREALILEFLTVLGKAVLPRGTSAEATKARATFYRYCARLVGVAGIAMVATRTLTPNDSVVPEATAIAGSTKSISDALSTASDELEARATDPTLSELRLSIRHSLSSLQKPVIILIDDIDRLETTEVRTIFQLLKACADFPNLSYFLLYDRIQVLHALRDTVNDPDAFLEKIVSQSFDLPAATTQQRSKVLEESLLSLELHEGLPKGDMDRLSSLFDAVLLPGLPTLRQVKRFVATARTLLPGVIRDGFRSVDPADFLALEYIRQNVPALYALLRDQEAPIPGGRIIRWVEKDLPEKMAKRREDVVKSLDEPLRSLAKACLDSLLRANGTDGACHSSRRFMTDYWKPVYLGFCDARATVPESEWQGFMRDLEGGDLSEWMAQWNNRSRRDQWVTAICARAEEIPRRVVARLLETLFRWGDAHPYEESSMLHSEHHSWMFAVSFSATAVLKTIPKKKDKIAVLHEAIKESDSLISASLVLGMEASRVKDGGWGHWSDGADFAQLLSELEVQLTALCESDALWDLPDPTEALHAWHYLNEQAHREWWDRLEIDEDLLINYLNRGIALRMSTGTEPKTSFPANMVEAAKKVDKSRLTEAGNWARGYVLSCGAQFGRRPRSSEDDDLDLVGTTDGN